MTLSIRLCGTQEEINEFVKNNEGLVLQASMPIANSNGQIFQYCKWENPNG